MRPDEEDATVKSSNSSSIWTRIWAFVAIVFIILFLFVLGAAIYFYISYKDSSDVCLSPGCIRTASVILSSMNASIDPCDDFYEFACGQWIKGHPIPDDAPSVSNFENLGQDLEFALKELLEEGEGLYDYETSAVGKAKYFYNLCLNESEILENWRTTFDEVVRSFGGWPSLGDPVKPDASIEMLYADMVAKFKADSLFKATVQPDDKNSQRHVLLIDQPQLNLFARDFYVAAENEERMAYLQLIRDVLILLDADRARAIQDAREIIHFETALANITMADEQRHDIAELYTKVTLGDMKSSLPHFNWPLFFNHMFKDLHDKTGRTITFDDQTEIVVYGYEFLRRLDVLIPMYDTRVIVNYLEWCWFFKTMLRDLPDPFALTIFKFYKTLNIMNVQKVRWHGCVTRINSLMPMATSAIYVKNHFDHEAKQQVEEMISLIMESFVDLLLSEDWLTQETKQFAKQKVNEMKRKIGYPDYLNEPTSVNKEYKTFTVYPGHYYKTKFSFYEQYQRDVLERITEAVDRERWVAGAALVNAFYSPNTNEIIFPAGILQPVFYSKDFPSSMNFGGIGVVIGHEITHGFDDRGRLYDNLGNIRQWWDNATISKFEHKAQCIEKQYSSYVLEQISMQINGKSTKGENIADNGGLKQAYRAYKKYERTHSRTPRLPGVNLTHDQLFFLNYAQIWCGTMNDKEAIRKLRTSEHSPGPISIFFTIVAGCSEYWARAEVIDTRKFRHAGSVHTGIFVGNRDIDFGQGDVNTRFTVFQELQDGTSFFSRTVWIFFLFFESMALIWSMIGVITCVFSMTSLALDNSVAGPNGIYLWSLLSSVSHGGALALFYSQFQSSIKISMLLEEHHDIGFTTFNQASLSYAFYMSVCGLFALYIPPLTLVVFTENLISRKRSKTSNDFDPTLMLY